MSLTQEQVLATAEKYARALNAGDLDGVMALYSDDPTVEDPVGGGTVLEGTEAVRGFYETVTSMRCELDVREKRACGNELLFRFHITTHFDEESSMTIDVWDLMVHDDEGRVTSMKAYWGPDDVVA